MSSMNINRVTLTGNLTADPELRSLPSGMSVCKLRLASNSRRKEGGQWVDKPNYFDVVVWGSQGENAARYLTKGSPVAVDGRLEWREWETKDKEKRSAVEIVAETVQFLNGSGPKASPAATSEADVRAAEIDATFDVAPSASEGDIPF